MKFRFKLSLAMLLVGLLVLIASSFTYFLILKQNTIRNQSDSLQAASSKTAEIIDLVLAERAKTALTLSNSPLIIQSLMDSNASFANDTEKVRSTRIAQLNNRWKATKGTDNPFIQSYLANPVAIYLKKQQTLLPDEYGEIFLTNKYGALVASTNKLTTLAHAHKYWWKGAYAKGRGAVFLDDRGYDDSVGGYVLGLVVPIKKDGEVIGILKCNLNILGFISQALTSRERKSRLKLVRSGGMIVFESGSEPLSTWASEPIREAMSKKSGSHLEVKNGQESILIGLSPVSITTGEKAFAFGGSFESIDHKKGNTGEVWFVLSYRSLEDVLAPVTGSTKNLIALGILLTLILAGFALILSRHLMKPIKALAEGADQIGQGNLSTIIDVRTNDEFSSLADSFNQMARNLETTMATRDELLNVIAKKKRTEEDLRQKDERLSAIFENATVGIGVIDSNGYFSEVNNTLAKMHGYTPEKLRDLTFEELTYQDDIAESRNLFHEPFSENTHPQTFKKRFIRSNGEIWWAEISTVPLTDRSGQRIGQLGVVMDITERLRFEKELIESESKHRLLAENVSDVIWTMNMDLRFTYISPSVTELRGYSVDEAMDQSLDEMMSPGSCKQVMSILGDKLQFIEAGQKKGWAPVSFEAEQYCKDGTKIHTQTNARILKGPEGQSYLIVGVTSDITERKLMEKALRESEQRYSTLFTEMLDGFALHEVICDEQGDPIDYRFLAANPAFERLTGLKAEEIVGRSVLEILPQTESYWIQKYGRVALTGEPVFFENYSQEMNKFFEVTAYRTAPRQFACIFADITDRKRASDALEESEHKFRSITEQMSEMIFLTDREGNISYVSPPSKDIFGLHPDDMEGNHFTSFLAETDIPKATSAFTEAINKGTAFSELSLCMKHRDGSEFSGELNANAYLKHDETIGTIGIIRNVTERVRAEEEKERLESQLRQAQKMEALGTLAGGIAHDFNNILTAIIGYSELTLEDLETGRPDPRQIEEIIRAGKRAQGLVTQILTFSRKLEPDLRPTDLNKVVSQTETMIERLIPKMVTIEHILADDLWLVNADPSQLSQILMNLSTNANDAMPDGGRLIIETENVILDEEYNKKHAGSLPGEYVQLTLSDTGQGMDKETIEHIFDPFFTQKEVGKGTGLGLATVYGIVKNHGGYVTCYSEVDQGTTFKVYLPAIRSGDELSAAENIGDIQILGDNETILLVDDEKVLRDLGRQILTRQGYTIILAETGEEALDIYNKQGRDIDLVVLDISMPGMGGYKCLQELLKLDSKVKVIISSGYSRNGQLKNTMKLGAAGFVPKPFSKIEILRMVREVLDG